MRGQLLLTFDVEDFISDESNALLRILKLLQKHNLQGLFFITGHMAEKLISHQHVLDMLTNHEIGFHSSAHSVRPTICEYCDVEGYEAAIQTSIERETSHINPLTGEIERTGGTHALRDLFPSKNIEAYRAPGYCCPPPHLEAISKIGFKYDFSWDLSKNPVSHKGITFYPRPIFPACEKTLLTGENRNVHWAKLLRSIIVERMTILDFHPNVFINKDNWDSIYQKGNPPNLNKVRSKNPEESRMMFAMLDILLEMICCLENLKIINTSPRLAVTKTRLDVAQLDFCKIEESVIHWPRMLFAYEPKHIRSQLSRFLGVNLVSTQSPLN